MSAFKFPQRVMTPKGEATFIGDLTDGARAQVSRRVHATEYTREECERFKPSVKDMTASEFKVWQSNATFTVNEIYNVDQLAPASDQVMRSLKINKWQADALEHAEKIA